jgi:prepilin peptidase CpaA
MLGELLLPLCGLALIGALFVAAYTDLKHRLIFDWLNLAIACAAPLAWWAQGLSLWPDVALQLSIGLGFFLFFLLQFNFGVMGGGDVKLAGALGLWIAPSLIVPFLMIMAVAGAVISIVMMINLRLRGQAVFQGSLTLPSLDDDTNDPAEPDRLREAPYGVAIAAGGCWVVYQQYINQFLQNSLN